MPILAVLQVLLQVYFAVHAYQNGKDRYWIYIIAFLPGLGCAVYFFVEFLPDLRSSSRAKQLRNDVVHAVNPGRELRRLEDQVELTPSFANKKALASGYLHAGMFDESLNVYKDCLQGTHSEDQIVLEGMSCAYFFKGDMLNAKLALQKLLSIRDEPKMDRFELMLAQAHEQLGESRQAEEQYQRVVPHFSGEEARYRYAVFLKNMGKGAQAESLFKEILKNARLSPKHYKRAQKQWIMLAKKG